MNIIFVVGAIAILIGLFKASTNPKIPQSPAACGIAFFIATAGVGSIQYLLSLLPIYYLYLISSLISVTLLSTYAGYIAARTTEDTASMNAKIVAGVTFVPFLGITYMSFLSLPSWVNYYSSIIFIPCILLGLKLNKMYNKSNQLDSQKARTSV